MAIYKYLNWRDWFYGLVDSAIPAGATAIMTLLVTNGTAATFASLKDMGMNWKQALAQVGIHMIIATARYLQTKPRPVEVTENIDTVMLKKDK